MEFYTVQCSSKPSSIGWSHIFLLLPLFQPYMECMLDLNSNSNYDTIVKEGEGGYLQSLGFLKEPVLLIIITHIWRQQNI